MTRNEDAPASRALAMLGRFRVLAGRPQEGERLLHEAVELASDPEEAAFAHGLIAEARVMAGRSSEALALAELVPPAGIDALIHRVRGVALAQLGRSHEAQAELESALTAARAAGDELEVAQVLDALCRVNALDGSHSGRSRERDALVRRLGLSSLPSAPVAAFPPRPG